MALTERVLERDRPLLTFFLPLALTPPSSPGILPIRDFSNCKNNTCIDNFRTKELTLSSDVILVIVQFVQLCCCCQFFRKPQKYKHPQQSIIGSIIKQQKKRLKSYDCEVVIVKFTMKLSRAYVADNEWWSPLGAGEFGGRDVVTLPAGGGGGRPRMTNRRNGWLVVGFTVLSRVHLYKRPTEKTERQS